MEEKQSRTRKINVPGYMWRDEVKTKLGIDNGMLENYVANGRIRRMHPVGLKQWVYNKDDVNALYEEIQTTLVRSHYLTPTFTRATVEDMPAIMNMLIGIFPEIPPPSEQEMQTRIARRVSWLRKNPDVCYILKIEEKPVGAIFLLPLLPEKIEQILASEKTPPIYAEEVQTFEPGKHVHIWVMSLGITAETTRGQKQYYGQILLRRIREGFVTFGKRGYIIDRVVARSNTKDGIRIMKELGFTEIPSTTSQRNFIVDIPQSGIPIVMEYKKALGQN